MKTIFEPETEEFGTQDMWRLISRGMTDGLRTSVRAMPVRGKGVLVQTARRYGDGEDIYDAPFMMSGVLIMESITVEASSIVDENNVPVSRTIKCVGREMVEAKSTKEKFQPKSKKRNGKPTPFDNVEIIPGVILTVEQRMVRQPEAPQPEA